MAKGRARVKSTGSASSSSAGLDRSQVVGHRDEFERMYPYAVTLKEMMRHAMILTGNERTELIFSVLRRLEHYMGSEVTKLKRRPNRATRYARGIRKLTSMTKLVMAYLPNEAEAYPTLGLILVHYLDIVLDSSWKDRQSTKIVAATTYAFVKYMFDDEFEYVLDVVLTSIADKVAAEEGSIGYYIFVGVVRDIYFYYDKSSTLAKYCAIASLLSSLKRDSGDAVVKNAIGKCLEIPTEFEKYVKDTFDFPKTHRFGISTAIEKIDYRKVANMSRRRLVIVGGSKANKTRKSAMAGGASTSSVSSCRNEEGESNCFFLDSHGSHSDVHASGSINFSSLRDACVDDEERQGFFLDKYPNLQVVSSHETSSGQFPQARFDYKADETKDSDNEDVQNKETEVEHSSISMNKHDASDTENFANQLLPFEHMFERRNMLSRTNSSSIELVTSVTPPAPSAKLVEDSDIEMIMEDIKNQDEGDDVDSLDLGDEKDEADPESGESDVPVYNKSHIHQGRAASESSDTSDEDEANINSRIQQNCSRIKDAISEAQMDAAKTEKSVQVAQVDKIDNMNSLRNGSCRKSVAAIPNADAETAGNNQSNSRLLKQAYVRLTHVEFLPGKGTIHQRVETGRGGKKSSPNAAVVETSANVQGVNLRGRSKVPKKESGSSSSNLAVSSSASHSKKPKLATADAPVVEKAVSSVELGGGLSSSSQHSQLPLRTLRKRTYSTESSVDTNSSVRRSSRLASKETETALGTISESDILLAKLDEANSGSQVSPHKRESRRNQDPPSVPESNPPKPVLKISQSKPSKKINQQDGDQNDLSHRLEPERSGRGRRGVGRGRGSQVKSTSRVNSRSPSTSLSRSRSTNTRRTSRI